MRFVLISIISVFLFVGAAWAKPPAGAFGQLPMAYDAAISPDGKKLAAYLNMDGSYGLGIYYLDGSGQAPFAIGMSEGLKPQWVKWANNNIVLASFWESHKYRGTPIATGHIYSFNLAEKKGEILISPDNAKSTGTRLGNESFFRQFNNDVIDFLPNDPEHILMSFSDENVFAPDVQRVNVSNGNYRRLRRGSTTIQEWYTDLRGEVRIGQGREDKTNSDWTLRIRDVDDDQWRSHKDYPGLDPDESIYGFTSDPNELIVGRYNGKDTRGLYVYNLGQKSITRTLFHNDDYDVGSLIYSNDGSEIVGASYVSDSIEVELFGDRESTLDRLRAKYDGFAVDYVDSTKDYSKVIVRISSPSDAGGMFVVNTATDKLSLVSKQYEGFESAELGAVSSVRYTARDGQKIPAYVTLPPSITDTAQLKNLPFIILPHGGPFARDSKRFDYFAQFFATRGYGVLQMNFRGSVGYGKEFTDAGRERWVVMQEDVEDGTRWLIEKGYADPNRICIAGWSYGGYAALIGSIKNPDLYACTVSMAGVTDLKDLINDMKQYRFGRLTAKGFLKGFEDKDDLKENSPVKRADEMSGPIFLAHGTLDQSVHFDQFKRMKSALKDSDAKVTALQFKDEDHYLSKQEHRIEFFNALEKFLEKSIGKSEHAL
ncbi:MAG: S9 family peptidase [Hellea sp.]|nr:S9 family peptidase [Hellea sp.]